MPKHDPIPPAQSELRRRFMRALRLLAVLSAAVAAISALLVARSVEGIHVHMLAATALGTGFTVFVGGALMTLVFLSASTGHDADAGSRHDQEND